MPTNTFKVGEMLNKRSPFSKTWINFDGSFTTEINSGVIHFEDVEGNLHNIDTDLFDEADLNGYDGPIEKNGKEALKEAKERSRAAKKANKLDRDAFDYQGLKVPFEAKLPKNFKRGYGIKKDNDRLKFKPVGASPAKGFIDEEQKNVIHYQDAWNDADVLLELTSNGIKETIILKTDRAPLTYSFEVSGTLEDDLTACILKLAPAWLEDANKEKRDVEQTIRREGDKTFIDIVADVSGLVYPIAIDPTVTIADASIQDTFSDFDAPTSVHYNLSYLRNVKSNEHVYIKPIVSTIPSDAVITTALLGLYFYSNNGFNTAGVVNAYEVSNAWNHTTLNWNNAPNLTGPILSSVTIPGQPYGFYNWNITSLVNAWVNGSKNNNGVVLQNDTPSADKLYRSSDWSTLAERPKLTITYNVPPTAPTVTTPNGGETWNSSHTVAWLSSKDEKLVEIAPNGTAGAGPVGTFFGQTYTAENTGELKSVAIKAGAGTFSNITLSVKNESAGVAGTTTYATKTLTNYTVPNDGYVVFLLDAPLNIIAGQKLAFEFNDNGSNIAYNLSTSNPYAGGNAYSNVGVDATYDWNMKIIETISTGLQYQIQLTTDGTNWSDIVALTAAGATSYVYDFINKAETSTAKIRIRAFDGSAYGPWDESNGVFTIVHNTAPNAPINLSPATGIKDRAAVTRFSWTHSDPNGTDPQSKFDLQWRLQGAGTWNTITQTTTNNYYDFAATGLPEGTIEWQLRTYDQAGLSGPYSSVLTFTVANKPGAPIITAPTEGATVAISRPVIIKFKG